MRPFAHSLGNKCLLLDILLPVNDGENIYVRKKKHPRMIGRSQTPGAVRPAQNAGQCLLFTIKGTHGFDGRVSANLSYIF